MRWAAKSRAVARMAAFAGSTLFHAMRLPGEEGGDAERRLRRAHLTRQWGQSLCRWLGLRVVVEGTAPAGAVIVANHRSYADIPVLASCGPATFLAKVEIRGWPVIGWAATRAGTVYVDRGNAATGAMSLRALRHLVAAGVSPVVFPEGGTCRPPAVGAFQPGIFRLAAAARLPVVPAALEYERPEDAWTEEGDGTLLPHFLRCFSRPEIPVRIAFGPSMAASSADALRTEAEAWVGAHLRPPAPR